MATGEPRTSKTLAALFARELRAARRARGWTQAELAERIGIAVEVCGRLERGRTLPRADTLVKLAHALGTSADALLGRGEHVPDVAQAREAESGYADPPELRRLVRRLRRESPRTVRLLDALLSSLGAARAGRPRRTSAR